MESTGIEKNDSNNYAVKNNSEKVAFNVTLEN